MRYPEPFSIENFSFSSRLKTEEQFVRPSAIKDKKLKLTSVSGEIDKFVIKDKVTSGIWQKVILFIVGEFVEICPEFPSQG